MQLWQLKSMKSLIYKKWWITSVKRWRALCSHAILIRSNTWFNSGRHCILNMYIDLIFFQRVHNFSHEEHIIAHSYGHYEWPVEFNGNRNRHRHYLHACGSCCFSARLIHIYHSLMNSLWRNRHVTSQRCKKLIIWIRTWAKGSWWSYW